MPIGHLLVPECRRDLYIEIYGGRERVRRKICEDSEITHALTFSVSCHSSVGAVALMLLDVSLTDGETMSVPAGTYRRTAESPFFLTRKKFPPEKKPEKPRRFSMMMRHFVAVPLFKREHLHVPSVEQTV